MNSNNNIRRSVGSKNLIVLLLYVGLCYSAGQEDLQDQPEVTDSRFGKIAAPKKPPSVHSSPLFDRLSSSEYDWNLFQILRHNSLLEVPADEQMTWIRGELSQYTDPVEVLKEFSDISNDVFELDRRDTFEKLQKTTSYRPGWNSSGKNLKQQMVLFMTKTMSKEYIYIYDILIGLGVTSMIYFICFYLTIPKGKCLNITSFTHLHYAAMKKLNKVQAVLKDEKYEKMMLKADLLTKNNAMIYMDNEQQTQKCQSFFCVLNTLNLFIVLALFTLTLLLMLYVFQDIRQTTFFASPTSPSASASASSSSMASLNSPELSLAPDAGFLNFVRNIPKKLTKIYEIRVTRLLSDQRPYFKYIEHIIPTTIELLNEAADDLNEKIADFCDLNFASQLVNFDIDSSDQFIKIEELNEVDLPLKQIAGAISSPSRRFMELTRPEKVKNIIAALDYLKSKLDNKENEAFDISKFSHKEEAEKKQHEDGDVLDHSKKKLRLPLELSIAKDNLSQLSTEGIEDIFEVSRHNLEEFRNFYLTHFLEYAGVFSKFCVGEAENIFVNQETLEAYFKNYLELVKTELRDQLALIVEKLYIPTGKIADYLDQFVKTLFFNVDYALLPLFFASVIIALCTLILLLSVLIPRLVSLLCPTRLSATREELFVDCGSKIMPIFIVVFIPFAMIMLLVSIINIKYVYENKYALLGPLDDGMGDFLTNIINQEPMGDILNHFGYYYADYNLITVRRSCKKNGTLPFPYYQHDVSRIIRERIEEHEIVIPRPKVSQFASKEVVEKLRIHMLQQVDSLLPGKEQYALINKVFQDASSLRTILEHDMKFLNQVFSTDNFTEVINKAMVVVEWTGEVQDLLSVINNAFDYWQSVKQIVLGDTLPNNGAADSMRPVDPFGITEHTKYKILDIVFQLQYFVNQELNGYTLSCNNILNLIETFYSKVTTLFRIFYAIIYTQCYIMLLLLISGLFLIIQSNIHKTLLTNKYIAMNRKIPFALVYHRVFHIKRKFWIS